MKYKIIILIFLLLGCNSEDEDMRLFRSGLSNTEQEPTFNEFSRAITVEPIVFVEHRAFPSMVLIGEVIHLFYRLGQTHNSMDGVIMTKTSSDQGETWTDEVEIYNGMHLLIDYPEILEDNPLNVPDCRDPRVEVCDDGTILIMPFVSVGVAPDVDDRDLFHIYSTRIKVPLVNGVPQYGSETIYSWSEVRNKISFGTVYKDGVLHYGTYDRQIGVHRSTDNGVTIPKISDAFPQTPDDDSVNEHDFYWNGDKLVLVGRPTIANQSGKITTSLDDGVTWSAVTDAPHRIDGMEAMDLGDGRGVVAGRSNSPIGAYLYTLNNEIVEQPIWKIFTGLEGGGDGLGLDRGYCSIIRHPNGKIFVVSYHGILNEPPYSTTQSSVGLFFRQLNYDETTHLISFGND